MTGEGLPYYEEEAHKERWLGELAVFLVEANRNTWAADKGEIESKLRGYKEYRYRRGPWVLEDRHLGYLRAPGITAVSYEAHPVWTMAYGGVGQVEGQYHRAEETFGFLKRALISSTVESPIRGPSNYNEYDDKHYIFDLRDGDLGGGSWREEIYEGGDLTFQQSGVVSLVIDKDKNHQPVYPWDLQ